MPKRITITDYDLMNIINAAYSFGKLEMNVYDYILSDGKCSTIKDLKHDSIDGMEHLIRLNKSKLLTEDELKYLFHYHVDGVNKLEKPAKYPDELLKDLKTSKVYLLHYILNNLQ